ncbi:MAG: TlpA family protein disulfide reductase [Candidatus Cloacimonetes bacterium]|nr:TlpA family protein disulfide reductase [Candidatus Cloacimonadota bacterium]
MKKLLLTLIAVLLGLGLFAEILGSAPDFQLEDADGNMVRLSQCGDKLIVLDFWATWCVPCVKELPQLSALQDEFGEEIQVIAITIDKARSISKAKALVKSNNFSFITLFDPNKEVATLYNMVNPPRTMIIDPQMNIIFQHNGYKLGDEIHLKEAVEKWLASRKTTPRPPADSSLAGLSISGINEAKYVYNSAPDSVKHYLQDEFKFTVIYNNFRFGMKYEGYLPKYEKFTPLAELEPGDLSSSWTDRYVEYNTPELLIRGGNFDMLIGSGMVLHAYYNSDLDKDYCLDGFYGRWQTKVARLQAFYGVLENASYPQYDDVINGLDLTLNPIKPLTLGAAAFSNRQYQGAENHRYNIREVYTGRLGFAHEKFEIKGEYAKSKQYHNEFGGTKYGTAFYGDINVYLGTITLTTAYKNYQDFANRLNELPTANSSEKPLVDYGYDVGADEYGFMGVIRYVPNKENEFVLNAGYGKSDDYDIQQVDIHSEYRHDFSDWTIRAQIDQVENKQLLNKTDFWTKQFTPALIADFMAGEFSTHLKIDCEIETHESYQHEIEEKTTYEPLFQIDLGKGAYSLSLLSSYFFTGHDDIMDYTPKIGAELFIQAWHNTDLKLFVGSEKGGLVCRNGVCNYQAPFDGARMSVTTRF